MSKYSKEFKLEVVKYCEENDYGYTERKLICFHFQNRNQSKD